jgi:hypothetical protein
MTRRPQLLYCIAVVAVIFWPLPACQAENNPYTSGSSAFITSTRFQGQSQSLSSSCPSILRKPSSGQTLRHRSLAYGNAVLFSPKLRDYSRASGIWTVKCVMNLEKAEDTNLAECIADLIGSGEVSITVREARHGEGDSVALLRCRYHLGHPFVYFP